VAKATRRASLGSLAIAAALPALVALVGRAGWEVGVAAAVSVLVVVRHLDNIRRLVHHREQPFHTGSTPGPPPGGG
jgi:glycerol-3-phosphate acyltransferase PlsY